jgi:hypothetical protein
MTDEVHVTTSQSDAAKMIVERNSANGRPTPDAIRKIAEAQPEVAEGRPHFSPVRSGRRRFGSFLARMRSERTVAGGAGLNTGPQIVKSSSDRSASDIE